MGIIKAEWSPERMTKDVMWGKDTYNRMASRAKDRVAYRAEEAWAGIG
jgi:hypothetical protein